MLVTLESIKQDFAQCLMPLGRRSNSMMKHINKSYLRGIMRVKLKPQLGKKWESLISARTERCLVIFTMWTMFLDCLCPDRITEWLQMALSDVDVL